MLNLKIRLSAIFFYFSYFKKGMYYRDSGDCRIKEKWIIKLWNWCRSSSLTKNWRLETCSLHHVLGDGTWPSVPVHLHSSFQVVRRISLTQLESDVPLLSTNCHAQGTEKIIAR
jgi:hypothetical protein